MSIPMGMHMGIPMGFPMGTAEIGTDFMPAWEINMLKGECKKIKKNLNLSNRGSFDVPQLEVDLEYELYKSKNSDDLFLKQENLLMEIIEHNSIDIFEDEFEMELYLENNDSGLKDIQEHYERHICK